MLAADKLLLQSSIKQNAIQLKEKEFSLHTENYSNVGTMASVLAGFAMTAFIEFSPPAEGVPRWLKFIYYCCVMVSLGSNMFCVVTTAALSVLGTGLALRGPDGSMITAVEGMYGERQRVFTSFGVGVVSLQLAALFGSWILMDQEAALCCSLLLIYLGYATAVTVRRIQRRLSFDEHDAVDFNDIFLAVQSMMPTQILRTANIQRRHRRGLNGKRDLSWDDTSDEERDLLDDAEAGR